MRLPGGVPSAHVDRFARELLPPPDLWPVFDYSVPHLSHYPDRINAAAALIDTAVAAGFGSKPVFHYGEGTWSYAHLLDRAERIARVLTEDFGLVPGGRVLLRSANTPMLVACWLAVLKAGGICVTTMPLLRAKELSFIVEKARINIALCELDLSEEMELTRQKVAELRHVGYFTPLGTGADSDADLDRRAEAKPAGFVNVDTAADDVALITFTSGTTGNPKGAMHFHRDILACCDCWPRSHTLEPDEVVIGSPSIAFTYGKAAFMMYPLRYRATAVLVAKPTPEMILEGIQRHRATSLYAVPTAFHAMLGMIDKYDISSLRKGSSAGEHLRPRLYDDWLERTGVKLVNGIGMTEMLTHFICQTPDVARPGATGRPVDGYTACILDDDFNPLPPGSKGRLAVRGPTGCRYLDDQARQAVFVKKGWNVTGDIMEQDEDGWFWYVDRSDDMIVSSGYNISAQEVERAILEHPKVSECAVVGVPDEARGTIVRACIVLDNPSQASTMLAEEIQNFVKANIAPYKYPRDVRFVDFLPKTQTGKIQRFRLRDL
ncbi:Acyl-coenzyme A synthetase/AMP-(fatty) acid ligase [Paramagnetospirillum caucaseum]|uniref:Acyl-coenzyme A synthetase/AMP-(Fatty) acid ligase n=1 Tax=Paramagnetospirillum caucaseum TaxID=1244869 RepID=M2ZAM0_9PROT|nr:AMP-binding protein [Paramagnetospirillum caucaseum]EME71455.1 Acyl-coenzyme A synthetase/AMP-(fatty) acid ligase [Paramagnetospirillum caucaseum]